MIKGPKLTQNGIAWPTLNLTKLLCLTKAQWIFYHLLLNEKFFNCFIFIFLILFFTIFSLQNTVSICCKPLFTFFQHSKKEKFRKQIHLHWLVLVVGWQKADFTWKIKFKEIKKVIHYYTLWFTDFSKIVNIIYYMALRYVL